MKTKNFSNETLNMAVNALNEYQDEIKQLLESTKTVPLSEVAQRYLMDKLGMTQLEAAEVCEKIQKGMDDFDSQFKANAENGQVNLRTKLEEITASMDDEKCKNYLCAVLTAFQIAQLGEVTREQVSDLQDNNSQRSKEELIDEIERQANGAFHMEPLAEFVNDGISAENILKLSNQIKMNKDEYCYLAALMLYVGQHEGKLKLSDSDMLFSANMIGSLARAGIETMLLTGELKEGKIDLKRWQTVLKWILGALLGCALFLLAIFAVSSIAASILGLTLTILGTSMIAYVIAAVVSVYACWDLSKYAMDGIIGLLDILSGIYDQYIEPVTQKMKSWAISIKEWFANMFKKVAEAGKPRTEETQTETVTVQPTGIVTA